MALPFTFNALTAATMTMLDANFAAVGAMGVMACTITGTNTITLTPNANQPSVAAYANYQCFSGVIQNTNTGATIAQVGALATKKVYLDSGSGPVQMAGGELIAGNYAIFSYDSALDGGSGGLHVTGQIPITELLDTISGGSTQGAMLYRGSTLWSALAPSTSLTNLAGGATPSWVSLSTQIGNVFGTSVGIMLYAGAGGWTTLATPTVSGWVIKWDGTIPTWAAP